MNESRRRINQSELRIRLLFSATFADENLKLLERYYGNYCTVQYCTMSKVQSAGFCAHPLIPCSAIMTLHYIKLHYLTLPYLTFITVHSQSQLQPTPTKTQWQRGVKVTSRRTTIMTIMSLIRGSSSSSSSCSSHQQWKRNQNQRYQNQGYQTNQSYWCKKNVPWTWI